MLGIADQIQLAAEHARKIVTDITRNREAAECLALLRPYLFAFEREVKTLELQSRMRDVLKKHVEAEKVAPTARNFRVIKGGA